MRARSSCPRGGCRAHGASTSRFVGMGTTAYCAGNRNGPPVRQNFRLRRHPTSRRRNDAPPDWSECWRSVRCPYRTARSRPSPSADGHVPAWTNVSETAGSPNAPAGETRAQARRRSRATRTASLAGRRIVRDGTRPRSRSASERVAADSGSPPSVRAARRSATSAVAAAERAARRGAGSDTRERSPRRGGSGSCRVTTWGAYQPYRPSNGARYPPDGPCSPPGSADGIPLTT
jgi:hypothetical protein